jgi:hypothetical protein
MLRFLVGELLEEPPLGKPRMGLGDNIKMMAYED